MLKILSSRKLTASQAKILEDASITWEEYEAIKIDFVDFQVSQPVTNAIITSQNTVKALLQQQIKIERCFCVGQKTKHLLEKHQIAVVEMTDYGSELGALLVKNYALEKFVFFCGNKRRDELPDLLTENNVNYTEIQVYKNVLNPVKVNPTFDGVLFFSPSQVKSYVQKNDLHHQKAFCIGKTTAAEARKYTSIVIISNKPTVEEVLTRVVKFYEHA